MLSKSTGQILRMAATFHVLFTLDDPSGLEITSEISEKAIAAAIKFVQPTNSPHGGAWQH